MGILNGFFGGGGGMVCVPYLEKYTNITNKQSHATTLTIILPLSIFSSFVYITNNHLEIENLVFITIGMVCGGIIGAFCLKKLNFKVVRFIFAIVMLAAGIRSVL